MRRYTARDSTGDAPPSDTLWVGNIPSDTVDADLMGSFGDYGALDCATMHGGRSYAYLFFRSTADAQAAKKALQGAKLRGNSMRIDFAWPAKPCKHLWVGGICSAITKELIKEEFLKFGKIEDYKFLKERKSAFVDYSKIEEAIVAQKNLDGKIMAGVSIRVDFLRPQPSRREWVDRDESRDSHFSGRHVRQLEPWISPNRLRSFHDPYHTRHSAEPYGRIDGPPSNVLWVGHPPSVQIDEQMLHNAMILFGEIERIKCFPEKSYALVDFRSVDEARRAKEGLQGRLFNDPRIQILYTSSEVTASAPLLSMYRTRRPDMLTREPSLGPVDLLASSRSLASSNLSGLLLPGGLDAPNLLVKSPIHVNRGDLEINDFEGVSSDFPDEFGGRISNRRSRSPSSLGMFPPVLGEHTPFRSSTSAWDAGDMRELKRSRIGDFNIDDDPNFYARRVQWEGSRDSLHFPYADKGGRSSSDVDLCWRGVIAKGGGHVCFARCVPIGKGIDAPFPEILNCSARTGLDMLTKYYAEADGFDVVFFLPDSEDDFASYTEFLRYLGLKNRAGVAKLEDGTTLFLVPPSEFLTEVLKVSGPERLYGVVLRLSQQSVSETLQEPQPVLPPPPPHHPDIPQVPNLEKVQKFASHTEEPTIKAEYSRPFHEVHNSGSGNPLNVRSDAPPTQPPDCTNIPTVSLTPELLATLVSLIPQNATSNGVAQFSDSSSARPTQLLNTTVNDGLVAQSQGWIPGYENHALVAANVEQQPGPAQPQFLNVPNGQASQSSVYVPYANAGSGVDLSLQSMQAGAQFQDQSFNAAHVYAIPSIPANSYAVSSHGGQFVAQNNQQYQFEYNNAAMQYIDASGTFSQPALQQWNPAFSVPVGGPMVNMSQSLNSVPMPINGVNEQFPFQGQQLHPVHSASVEAASTADPDKNTRYQSTLQFAANLLYQIQQKQQQQPANPSVVQGSGNQQ